MSNAQHNGIVGHGSHVFLQESSKRRSGRPSFSPQFASLTVRESQELTDWTLLNYVGDQCTKSHILMILLPRDAAMLARSWKS